MKKILLSRGKYAIVDDEDYDFLMCLGDWHVQIKPNGKEYSIGHAYSNGRSSCRRMHRIIMWAKPHEIVDHINGNGLDNRKANLRIVDHVQNCRYRKTTKNRHGYKGIFPYGKRWGARICLGKRETTTIGVFDTKIQAANAYDTMAEKYFGEHAWTNKKNR